MRRPAAAASVALLCLATAACGGSKHASTNAATTARSAPAAVRDAVHKTVKAGSEHLSISATAVTGGQTVKLAGSGDFDSADRRGKLHATVALGGVQTSIDEVLDGTTAYASSPMLTALLPAGKSWLKIDLSSAGKALGIDTSVLAAQNPAVALEQLQALKGVHEVGSATIDGVQTTHYRGTIDASKLPRGSAAAIAQAGGRLGPLDVWVGSDGYVRRERITTSGGGQGAKTTVTTTLSQFGESTQVSVPAAKETVDASKVSLPGIGG
jgi:hypothetical protein